MYIVGWSPKSQDRRVALATLNKQDMRYEFRRLWPVYSTGPQLLKEVFTELGSASTALMGLNMPIGMPAAYAKAAGIPSFRGILADLGKAVGWENFYTPTDKPELRQPFCPSTLGATFKKTVAIRAFALQEEGDLYRRCERKTAKRYQAKSIFDLTFPSETGRSALMGWPDLLMELSRSAQLWPFDGKLTELLARPGFTVAEVYPDEAIAQLNLRFAPDGERNKRSLHDRQDVVPLLLEMSESSGISISRELRDAALSGLNSQCEFEVFSCLIAAVRALRQQTTSEAPESKDCLEIEGWILGQSHELYKPLEAPRAFVQQRSRPTSRRTPFFVQLISWGPRKGRKTIEFAYPTRPNLGAINVICGLNNSGKSFLLEQLHRVLKRKPNRRVLRVEPRPTRQPRILFFGRAWEDKEKVGLVNLEQTAESLSVGAEHGDYLRSGLSLLASQMAQYLKGVSAEEAPQRIVEAEVRDQIRKKFKTKAQIYKCNGNDPLIQKLESFLDGHLYFRCGKEDKKSRTWNFEFVLYSPGGTTLPFADWSDGQRAIFYVLVCLRHFKPEIVLFDEIENHLHPAFISRLLEVLRATPAQTILATHHPHLIFSRYPDRVFFLETKRPRLLEAAPAQAAFSSEFHELERTVLTLEDNFEKLTSAYHLFEHQDDQLLRQAGYIAHRATLTLTQVLSSIFRYPPVSESRSPLPDSQTQQLAGRIRALAGRAEPREISVLDLGAGVGRQVAELAKLSDWQLHGKVRWTCFEPIAGNRPRLLERFGHRPDITIIGKASDLGTTLHDFCVLSNVLHELTPIEFVRYLTLADRHSQPGTGGLIILELFPLLHAESHAVPYESAVLRKILREVGYDSESVSVPVRQGSVSAYCLLAKRVKTAPSSEQMIAVIEGAWKEILADCLSSYALRLTPSDLEGYQSLVSRLTTIASIASWNAGKWTASWLED